MTSQRPETDFFFRLPTYYFKNDYVIVCKATDPSKPEDINQCMLRLRASCLERFNLHNEILKYLVDIFIVFQGNCLKLRRYVTVSFEYTLMVTAEDTGKLEYSSSYLWHFNSRSLDEKKSMEGKIISKSINTISQFSSYVLSLYMVLPGEASPDTQIRITALYLRFSDEPLNVVDEEPILLDY